MKDWWRVNASKSLTSYFQDFQMEMFQMEHHIHGWFGQCIHQLTLAPDDHLHFWLLSVALERISRDRKSYSDRKKKVKTVEILEDLLLKDPPWTGDLEGGGEVWYCHLGKYLCLLTSLEEFAQEGADFTKGEDKLPHRRVESNSYQQTPYRRNFRWFYLSKASDKFL